MKDFTVDGYVTKNIETRSTGGGQTVTRFSVNSPNYNRETRQSTSQFLECEYWHSGQGDYKAQNISEGNLLLLWGSLAYDTWQDKQTGQNRSKMYLKVREIGVIKPGRPRAPQQYQQQGYQQGAYQPQQYQQPAYAAPAPAYAQRPAAPAPAPQQVPQAPAQPAYAQPQPAAPAQQAAPPIELYDEDIPF